MSVASELNLLRQTKAAIKQSIINKGVSVSDSDAFSTYSSKIDAIETGSTGYEIEYEDYGAAYITVNNVKHYIPELFDDEKAIAYQPQFSQQSWYNESNPSGFEVVILNPDEKSWGSSVKRNATLNHNDEYTLNGDELSSRSSNASPQSFNFVTATGFNDLMSRKWYETWSYNSSSHTTNIMLPDTTSNTSESMFTKERIYGIWADNNPTTVAFHDNTNLRVFSMPWNVPNNTGNTGSFYNMPKLKAIIANDTVNSQNAVIYNCPELYIFKVNNLGYSSTYSTAYTFDLHNVLVSNYEDTYDETMASLYYTLTHLFDRLDANASAKTYTIKFNVSIESDLDNWIQSKYDGDVYPYADLSELMTDVTAKGFAITYA